MVGYKMFLHSHKNICKMFHPLQLHFLETLVLDLTHMQTKCMNKTIYQIIPETIMIRLQ
jgi:hypothetical protein